MEEIEARKCVGSSKEVGKGNSVQLCPKFVLHLISRFEEMKQNLKCHDIDNCISVEPEPSMGDPIVNYQLRVILIGDTTVGKTCMLRYFTDGHSPDDSKVGAPATAFSKRRTPGMLQFMTIAVLHEICIASFSCWERLPHVG